MLTKQNKFLNKKYYGSKKEGKEGSKEDYQESLKEEDSKASVNISLT